MENGSGFVKRSFCQTAKGDHKRTWTPKHTHIHAHTHTYARAKMDSVVSEFLAGLVLVVWFLSETKYFHPAVFISVSSRRDETLFVGIGSKKGQPTFCYSNLVHESVRTNNRTDMHTRTHTRIPIHNCCICPPPRGTSNAKVLAKFSNVTRGQIRLDSTKLFFKYAPKFWHHEPESDWYLLMCHSKIPSGGDKIVIDSTVPLSFLMSKKIYGTGLEFCLYFHTLVFSLVSCNVRFLGEYTKQLEILGVTRDFELLLPSMITFNYEPHVTCNQEHKIDPCKIE